MSGNFNCVQKRVALKGLVIKGHLLEPSKWGYLFPIIF